jgi:hypothetical protein
VHPTRYQIDYTGLHQIKGLAFIDKNNKLKVTGSSNTEQLPASKMSYPDYDKLRLGLQSLVETVNCFMNILTNKNS